MFISFIQEEKFKTEPSYPHFIQILAKIGNCFTISTATNLEIVSRLFGSSAADISTVSQFVHKRIYIFVFTNVYYILINTCYFCTVLKLQFFVESLFSTSERSTDESFFSLF